MASNQSVTDVKPNNQSTLDQKPQNNQMTTPIETEQLYTVVFGAGQWMGMYAFTYKDAGTVLSSKSY